MIVFSTNFLFPPSPSVPRSRAPAPAAAASVITEQSPVSTLQIFLESQNIFLDFPVRA